jgi:hypothetical protein
MSVTPSYGETVVRPYFSSISPNTMAIIPHSKFIPDEITDNRESKDIKNKSIKIRFCFNF